MIIIECEFIEGKFIPSRELTGEEIKTVTSVLTNGSNNTITYFQGDEPDAPATQELPYREVAAWKVRAILKQMGLIMQIETALNSLPENVKDIALSAWEYSATINQYSPTVKLIQQTCNLTDVQMEDIFNNAEKINI